MFSKAIFSALLTFHVIGGTSASLIIAHPFHLYQQVEFRLPRHEIHCRLLLNSLLQSSLTDSNIHKLLRHATRSCEFLKQLSPTVAVATSTPSPRNDSVAHHPPKISLGVLHDHLASEAARSMKTRGFYRSDEAWEWMKAANLLREKVIGPCPIKMGDLFSPDQLEGIWTRINETLPRNSQGLAAGAEVLNLFRLWHRPPFFVLNVPITLNYRAILLVNGTETAAECVSNLALWHGRSKYACVSVAEAYIRERCLTGGALPYCRLDPRMPVDPCDLDSIGQVLRKVDCSPSTRLLVSWVCLLLSGLHAIVKMLLFPIA